MGDFNSQVMTKYQSNSFSACPIYKTASRWQLRFSSNTFAFHVLWAGKSEQGLAPVGRHPLLDRQDLHSGRAGRGGHIRHPAGRIPGWEPGPAPGDAGLRVASVQGLLQKRPHVSRKTNKGLIFPAGTNKDLCLTHTHTHTLSCTLHTGILQKQWLTTLIPLCEIIMTQTTPFFLED